VPAVTAPSDIPAWLQLGAAAVSLVMFVGSLIAVPIVLVRLPPDYFARAHAPRALPVRILRNVLGAVLILLGVAMLVLPGQGMLTILVGVAVLELPFKRRLVRRILRNATVKLAVDRLRERSGRPPLTIPGRPGGAPHVIG
jgi:Putative transmembrane protein (PGPGW)